MNEEPEEGVAVTVPAPANFASEGKEALGARGQELGVPSFFAAAGSRECRAVVASRVVSRRPLACERADEGGVAT